MALLTQERANDCSHWRSTIGTPQYVSSLHYLDANYSHLRNPGLRVTDSVIHWLGKRFNTPIRSLGGGRDSRRSPKTIWFVRC
jgi:hypothetical protein